jgi:hypothetical protein
VIENKIAWIVIDAFFFVGGAWTLFFADRIIDHALAYTKPDSLTARLAKNRSYRTSLRVGGGVSLLISIAMGIVATSVWNV